MNAPVLQIKNTKCIHCGQEFEKRVPVADYKDPALHKGMIMVCSQCRKPMILGDADWRPLTREDFAKLPVRTKHYLLATAKGLEGLAASNKQWSPWDQKRLDGK